MTSLGCNCPQSLTKEKLKAKYKIPDSYEILNCYKDEKTKETMVIDPGGEVNKIIEMLDILQAKLKYIYITHCHGDHIGALVELKNAKGGKNAE